MPSGKSESVRKKIKILDAGGEPECIVDRDAAVALVDRGGYQFWNKGTSIRPIPTRRASDASRASLGENDTRALAGLDEMSPRRRERLAGWGLVPAEVR
jgi:hypothetical protein